jgi:phage gpG-like protein
MDLLGLTARLGEIALGYEIAKHEAVAEAAKIAERGAKARIGHYNGAAGPTAAWAPLADSTKEDRQARGFTADDPLERTGDLKDSITSGVDGNHGYVGTPLEAGLFAELGTSKEPPRSFLVGGFHDVKQDIEKAIGEVVVKSVGK